MSGPTSSDDASRRRPSASADGTRSAPTAPRGRGPLTSSSARGAASGPSTSSRPSLWRVLPVVLLLVAVPVAGCVGGQGGPGGAEENATDGDPGTGPGGEGPPVDGEPGAGETQHVHDRWWTGPDQLSGERTDTITLVEGTTYTIRSFRENPGEDPTRPTSSCPSIPDSAVCAGFAVVTPDETETGTRIVPPGTAKITIELEYDDQELKGNGSGIHVWYQGRIASTEDLWLTIGQDAMPAEPGTTVTIPGIDVRQTDDGHARSSAWRWLLEIRGNPVMSMNAHFTDPDGIDVKVTIKAHRGEGPLPLEPPHPTFYQDDPDGATDTYLIGRFSGRTEGQFVHAGFTSGELPSGCNYRPFNQCMPLAFFQDGLIWHTAPGYAGGRLQTTRSEWSQLEESRVVPLVPPGTELVKAVVRFSPESASEHGEVEVCLRTRTTDSQPPEGRVQPPCVPFDGQDEIALEVPIDGGDVDSWYANNWEGRNRSRWTFLVQIRAPEGQSLGSSATLYQPGTFQGAFEAVFLASSEPNLDEVPEWVSFGP